MLEIVKKKIKDIIYKTIAYRYYLILENKINKEILEILKKIRFENVSHMNIMKRL